jgi:hypothetical protein
VSVGSEEDYDIREFFSGQLFADELGQKISGAIPLQSLVFDSTAASL